ncbi:MAG: Ku protein, partial [Verrucomicrobia bacterium]|nr:Ku protein [Verrucomicrobiota bacterium]
MWTGTVSFALLSVPVKLFTATRARDIAFNQLERSTGARIKQRKVSSVTGEEVPSDQVVRGYDLGG